MTALPSASRRVRYFTLEEHEKFGIRVMPCFYRFHPRSCLNHSHEGCGKWFYDGKMWICAPCLLDPERGEPILGVMMLQVVIEGG